MDDLLQVGIITQPHGVHGEVKVFPTTNDVKRFKKLKEVLLDTRKEKITLEIESVKFFKQYAILKFRGFDSINDIEKYKGTPLLVTRENAVKLGQDEYFIADLIDMAVYDEQEQYLGVLTNVIETGANDVYEVKFEDGRQILFPAIKQCILNVDMEGRKMKVHIMDGLLD
ncbi:MAG: ribosome maturation factor RimM [Lachnospiraceae bacterium]|jgi:16S rRNA processing protein RimM|nr:ribosome maturation factor RimM [Lachnospiraceae bacterium]